MNRPSQADLESRAVSALEQSYSPYSQCRVGAAVEMEDGSIFTGANVENASYGGTICAERVAVLSAVHAGKRKIQRMAVASEGATAWPPCGLCLQTLAEFSSPETSLTWSNRSGDQKTAPFRELLPFAFTPEHLEHS